MNLLIKPIDIIVTAGIRQFAFVPELRADVATYNKWQLTAKLQ